MKSKSTLFVGILLLATGIVVKKVTDLNLIPFLLIIVGVFLKAIFIILKLKKGAYKPGSELMFLFFGLILFLTGIYMRSHQPDFYSRLLIFLGLFLKIVFIVMFILKVRVEEKKRS